MKFSTEFYETNFLKILTKTQIRQNIHLFRKLSKIFNQTFYIEIFQQVNNLFDVTSSNRL